MIVQENIPYTADEIKAMVKTCEKYNKALERAKDMLAYKEVRQEDMEYLFPELEENEDEKIRKSLINFLKSPFVNENITNEKVAPWIAWLEKQGDNKESDEEWEVSTGLYKCTKRMFDGSPEGRLLFEVGNLYKCISKHDIAEFESSYGHNVFLIDPVVREHFIKV